MKRLFDSGDCGRNSSQSPAIDRNMTKVKSFMTHRKAETPADCQDSRAIHPGNRAIAVADGVSQSMFPKIWADMLTESYVHDRTFSLEDGEKIARLRDGWWKFFAARLESKRKENSPMLWHFENSFAEEKSAAATFVGIRMTGGGIKYEALGDSCLIVVRHGMIEQLISSMPEGAGFDNYPDYIDSHPAAGIRGTLRRGTLEMSHGDKLFLATDALSARFDEERSKPDKGKSLVEAIDKIGSEKDFILFVDKLRDEGMSDDDTTLVCVEWENSPGFQVLNETPAAAPRLKRHHGRYEKKGRKKSMEKNIGKNGRKTGRL
ncbi:MAG: protein phosphatase 2C domain-containing protein [Tannerella sp.]|nr:protein phosphatase 2C domain-containing protein [Tannerella sp.]